MISLMFRTPATERTGRFINANLYANPRLKYQSTYITVFTVAEDRIIKSQLQKGKSNHFIKTTPYKYTRI